MALCARALASSNSFARNNSDRCGKSTTPITVSALKILTLGQIRSPGFDWAILEDFEPRLALVDESHNFRHSDTEQYEQASAYLRSRGLPVICLTATPRNRLAKDVYNQIALFHSEDEIDFGVTPSSLSKYFRLLRSTSERCRHCCNILWFGVPGDTFESIGQMLRSTVGSSFSPTASSRRSNTTSIRFTMGLYDRLRRLIEPPDPKQHKNEGLR